MFEIAYAAQPTDLLERLLARAAFPVNCLPANHIATATVLIEQSLSDFGDADAILLLDDDSAKSALFVEAKVKSSWRSIQDEFAKLLSCISECEVAYESHDL